MQGNGQRSERSASVQWDTGMLSQYVRIFIVERYNYKYVYTKLNVIKSWS